MTRYLIDTDGIIDYFAGVADSITLITTLASQGDELCTCSVVLAEVYAGLAPAERVRARTLLDALVFLSTSATAGQTAGEWRYAHARRGVSLPTTDSLIAATAHEHQAVVLTGNTKDFPMPEISTLPLPRPTRRRSPR